MEGFEASWRHLDLTPVQLSNVTQGGLCRHIDLLVQCTMTTAAQQPEGNAW